MKLRYMPVGFKISYICAYVELVKLNEAPLRRDLSVFSSRKPGPEDILLFL